MTIDYHHATAALSRLMKAHGAPALAERLAPKDAEGTRAIARGSTVDRDSFDRRWSPLGATPDTRASLLDARTIDDAERYRRNVENMIGTVKIPVGIAGPIRVNGAHAQGEYFVPLATTEATLVASYSRGAQLITEAGGCAAVVVSEGMTRAPGFVFDTLHEAGQFVAWVMSNLHGVRAAGEATTRHGHLTDVRVTLDGSNVYLIFEFTTGDAAGQNMVTIATQAICEFIVTMCPIVPRRWYVEANHSGDKKASAQAFTTVRGRSVTSEVLVPRRLVEERLHTTPAAMADYWRVSAVGGVMSGTIGVQGHYANGLAALFLACGQDVACVAESAVGVTRLELRGADLYASVTLPTLAVGTVGGGTGLPSQKACLDVLGLAGAGHANAFAEVAGAVALAGELSIVGALVANEFTRAHASFARVTGTTPRE
jgi:hydroxymethylglutaryl-CoA reductase (NADPH)